MLFLLITFTISFQDTDGLIYDTSKKKELQGGPAGLVTLNILASVEVLKGSPNDFEVFSYKFKSTLQKIVFQEGSNLSTIGEYAFLETKKLTSVNLSLCTKLSTVNNNAFRDSGLTEIIFPKDCKIESLPERCFCFSELKSITIPKAVKQIFRWSLKAYFLETIIFESDSNCEVIHQYAMEGSKISSITIPRNCKLIYFTPFSDCFSLTQVNVETMSSYYTSENGVLYNSNKSSLHTFPRALEIHAKIPSTVTKLEQQSFRSCFITAVTLPEGLISIDMYAFAECKNLTEINIPESVQVINDGAFRSCSIRTCKIPSKIVDLNNEVFQLCGYLTNVTFPSGFQSIGLYSFESCKSLVEVTLPDTLKVIHEYAFRYCTSLRKVILTQTLETIKGGIFEGCHDDLEVIFPTEGNYSTDNIQHILYSTNCTKVVQMFAAPNVNSITLPDSVEEILTGAFAERIFTSISFGKGLKKINQRAFYECSITSAHIPESVWYIDEKAFMGSDITELSMPGATSVNAEAFRGCTKLITVIFPNNLLTISTSLFHGCKSLINLSFDEECTMQTIEKNAFAECSSLQTVQFPNSLSNIGISAFDGKSLRRAVFKPDSRLKSIPYAAFKNSTQLISVSLPNVESIDEYAFAECNSLQSILFPSSVSKLGSYSFADCTLLSNITFDVGSSIEEISEHALDGLLSLAYVFVPQSNIKFFTSENNAVLYDSGMTKIVKYCCKNKQTVFDIPKSVNEVCGSAFEAASFIESVTIPSTVQTIGYRAFANCSSLSNLVIPDSVTKVGVLAFEGCSSLRCESVVYNQAIYNQLIAAQIPPEALERCVTATFTQQPDNIYGIQEMLTLIVIHNVSLDENEGGK